MSATYEKREPRGDTRNGWRPRRKYPRGQAYRGKPSAYESPAAKPPRLSMPNSALSTSFTALSPQSPNSSDLPLHTDSGLRCQTEEDKEEPFTGSPKLMAAVSLYEELSGETSPSDPPRPSSRKASSNSDLPNLPQFPSDPQLPARVRYSRNAILAVRVEALALPLPEELSGIKGRRIKEERGGAWVKDVKKSPVTEKATIARNSVSEIHLDPAHWRHEDTEEEKRIIQQAKVQTSKLHSEKSDTEKLQRSVKSILNKLSPDNLDKLKPQILEIAKDSEENMKLVIRSVFDKACAQSKYTHVYASLCQYLNEFFGSFCPSVKEAKKNVTATQKFREELLNLCQDAFDTQVTTEELRGLDEEETERRVMDHRLKTLGNVRFIGELYRVGLINITTLLNISRELIDRRLTEESVPVALLSLDESRLEAVYTLLGTVKGQFRDTSKIQKVVREIYATLRGIIEERADISAKTKFRLMVRTKQNLIDEQSQMEERKAE